MQPVTAWARHKMLVGMILRPGGGRRRGRKAGERHLDPTTRLGGEPNGHLKGT